VVAAAVTAVVAAPDNWQLAHHQHSCVKQTARVMHKGGLSALHQLLFATAHAISAGALRIDAWCRLLRRTNLTNDVLGVVGRVLISCILLSIIFKEREYMSWAFLVPTMGMAGTLCFMLLAGFKAEVAAIAQAVLLVLADFYSHSFFRLNANHWERDLHQYYFFQLLTVCGAMLLISSCGAGRFSVDKFKKGH